jgi:hypothetical protein
MKMMTPDFNQDGVNNAIYKGICQGIEITIEKECFGSAVILVLSAIDAMAYLAMPDDHEDVTRKDFIQWAEKYIRFPSGELPGADLYGARCAMLHTYGAHSKMSREGECRAILWMSHSEPPIRTHVNTPGYVMVSIPTLQNSLFDGINRFLIDVFREPNSDRAKLINRRLNKLVQKMDAEEVLNPNAEGA